MAGQAKRAGDKPHKRPAQARQPLRLWVRLLNCTRFVEKRIQNLMREQETTLPRFDALAALNRAPEGLTMGELSKRMLVSNGNVTGIIARLEEEGLVSREALPEDKRTFVAKITERGQTDLEALAVLHEQLIDSMFAGLTAAELEILVTLLDKIRAFQKRYEGA